MPNRISLPSGVEAEIILTPEPVAAADGSYPLLVPPAQQPAISLTFRKGDVELAREVPWDVVISGSDSFSIQDGLVLTADDLDTLDSQGWDYMMDRGMFPTAFVG